MPNRGYTASANYRYGFNGKENDNEVKGTANEQDYGMRVYDPRLGRFLSVDPIAKNYPQLTPYQFASNRPADGTDLDGREYYPAGRYGPNQLAVDASSVRLTSINPALIQLQKEDAPKKQLQKMLSIANERAPSTVRSHYEPPSLVERQQHEQLKQQKLQTEGYNPDGTRPAWMRLAENKTWNRFADNIVFPSIEMAFAADGIETLGTLRINPFAEGATKLVSSKMLEMYAEKPTFGSPLGTFVAPTKEIDALLSKGLSRAEIAGKLGITDPAFLRGDLIRIDVSPQALLKLDLRIPIGNEVGANSLFQIGGKTQGGLTEGVINGIPKDAVGVTKKVVTP